MEPQEKEEILFQVFDVRLRVIIKMTAAILAILKQATSSYCHWAEVSQASKLNISWGPLTRLTRLDTRRVPGQRAVLYTCSQFGQINKLTVWRLLILILLSSSDMSQIPGDKIQFPCLTINSDSFPAPVVVLLLRKVWWRHTSEWTLNTEQCRLL